ncbi:autotransporter assembly complex protein TamA [Kaistia geumhonensis]|uniref:Translocation and assembly module TamA n=1 Tax=Kaistia geumhonensis TaxID=410839 RepID=A0ABU0M5L9_9HYPH|nr:autotransporter assembly complex family protein [Kaistia geumhonensis]MCX5478517.1 autotransporter assembly complex protein TamA [Kaistia geumhonensis]MDQ0516265.1 translocation and assembly module TamA [Kaistia geumhonensis]
MLAALLVAVGSGAAVAQDSPSFVDRIRGLFGQKVDREPVVDAVPYTVTVDVIDAGRSLRGAIRSASNLQQMRRSPPSGAAGLLRRARSDFDLITAALYSEGYYAGQIAITVAGVPANSDGALAAIEAARAAGPVPVTVTVTPGPIFTFGEVRLLDAGSGKPIADVPPLRSLGIIEGRTAQSSAILAAESRITSFYRDRGYAFAKIVDKDVVADHARRVVDVDFYVATGNPVTFGPVTVSGTERLKPGFVEKRAARYIIPGEMFSQKRLADTRRSLLKYDAISGVRIIEGDTADASGRVPIDIEVTERKPRYIGFGAKYSTTDGASINGYWGHRNLFGGAETLRLDGQVSWYGNVPDAVPDANPFGYRFTGTFTKPGILTTADDLVMQAAVLREVTDAYIREAVTFQATVRRTVSDQLQFEGGIDLEASNVQDSYGTNDYNIAGVPLSVTYDTTDNALDPTKGIRATGTAEPFLYLGEAGAGPVMVKGQLSGYKSLDQDDRYIIAARIAAGSIIGAGLFDVPPQRRFYVGGGGTLRGFNYQSQSPRNEQGDIVGGLSYVAASAEARIKVTDTIGLVSFVDAGAASAGSTPEFSDIGVGVGLGLRYYTAIGPVRLDVAVPVANEGEDQAGYGVYLSLGQAF